MTKHDLRLCIDEKFDYPYAGVSFRASFDPHLMYCSVGNRDGKGLVVFGQTVSECLRSLVKAMSHSDVYRADDRFRTELSDKSKCIELDEGLLEQLEK